tara:strand:- start:458 stop:1441 length:984 start_codon:yes stop_codon:yes gene_type:complete
MSSILDQVVQVAVESTYGTASGATPRAYEAKADTFTRDVEYIDSVGFRRDLQTIRSDRSDTVSLGATGSIEMDIQNKGLGLLLQHALGTAVAPTQQGSSAAYLQTYSSDDTGPTGSYTAQVSRVDSGGTLRPFTYEGSVITGWNITQDLGAATSLTLNFDAENEQTSTGEFTPAYPSNSDVFTYTGAAIEIDDSAVTSFTSFSLDADLAMKTDRRFLKGSATKSQPKRNGVPSYTGTISGEFASLTQFAAFVAGTVFKLEFTVTGPTAIEGAYYPMFKVTLQACKWTGSTPVASLDDMTTIELPFVVLDNGSAPAVVIEYQSTDTAV